MPIHRDMKEFFTDNGYLVVESLMTNGEMEAVSQRTDEVVADPSKVPPGVSVGREGDTFKDKAGIDAQNRTVRGTAFMARCDPVFRAFAQHPKILEIVRGLLGGRVKLFRDQMLLKPPGARKNVSTRIRVISRCAPWMRS